MVEDGRGRLFRRKDGKYLIYLPKDVAEDSMFPFKGADSITLRVSFSQQTKSLLAAEWTQEDEDRGRRKWQEGERVLGRARLFRRTDGKYLIYLPVYFAEDTMFPFKDGDSIFVGVSFKPGRTKTLRVEKWNPPIEVD